MVQTVNSIKSPDTDSMGSPNLTLASGHLEPWPPLCISVTQHLTTTAIYMNVLNWMFRPLTVCFAHKTFHPLDTLVDISRPATFADEMYITHLRQHVQRLITEYDIAYLCTFLALNHGTAITTNIKNSLLSQHVSWPVALIDTGLHD